MKEQRFIKSLKYPKLGKGQEKGVERAISLGVTPCSIQTLTNII